MAPRAWSKREFLRCSLFGACGLFAGSHSLRAMEKLWGIESAPGVLQEDLWRWSKEALFYVSTPRGLKCLKCPNTCVLEEGQTGQCRNRVNYKGKMYSIAYGNPCAVHIDPIEKKPFFHFLPTIRAFSIATAGCNLRCLNCQNWDISQMSPKETENYDLMPARVVEECAQRKCESLAYTYSEPTTFFEYTYDTAKLARTRRIKNVLKSNGFINEEPLRMLCKALDAANIDLKSFDDDTYIRLSQGRLAPILRTLEVLHEEHVWLEVTNLIVPSWTDNLDIIGKMCEWLVSKGLRDYPIHFTRFVPQYKLTHLPLTPVATLEKARDIALKAGMRYPYLGNVPGHWAENTFCHQCGKMIIERRGYQILTNHLVDGKCEFCKERIQGVWSA